MSKVWTQLNLETGLAIRIFRTKRHAIDEQAIDPEALIREMREATAVHQIRTQVLENYDYECVHCGKHLTVETAEMDERQARGDIREQEDGSYKGGEVSVANGQPLCTRCHTQGPDAKHRRNPEWTQRKFGANDATV